MVVPLMVSGAVPGALLGAPGVGARARRAGIAWSASLTSCRAAKPWYSPAVRRVVLSRTVRAPRAGVPACGGAPGQRVAGARACDYPAVTTMVTGTVKMAAPTVKVIVEVYVPTLMPAGLSRTVNLAVAP